MKIKVVSGIMLTLLLTSMLPLAFNIQPAKSEPKTWTVDDDGPADFHIIQEAINAANPGDTIYVFSGTYYENVVMKKAVTLIGESKSATIIDGNGAGSVVRVEADNATVSNCTIQNGGGGNAGVFISRYSKHNVISDNIVTSNMWCGVFLDRWSGNNTFSGNTISNNVRWPDGCGLRLFGSNNNIFTRNVIVNNRYGIIMEISSGNYFRSNEIAGNIFNLDVTGYSLSDYVHDIDASNTVDRKPIYYWINKHDMQIPADAGYVAAVNSINITVKNLHLTRNGQGVLFVYTSGSLITQVNASNNVYAIYLYSSSYNTIVGNDLSNNNNGMCLYAFSKFNNIIGNTIASNNANGVYLVSSDNVFYHNNFVHNNNQVQVGNYRNLWDDGYPSGGNYWSDYSGTDFYSGPYQNETGSDGIGDTPYVIDSDNTDNYPFMKPLIKPYGGPHDIGITSITPSRTVVGGGYKLNITIKIVNYGINTETFNLTAYADTEIIQTITGVVLEGRNSTEIIFTWNTYPWGPFSNYTISAYATPVPGETDTSDNTLIDGWVVVTLAGDANLDGFVDMYDFYTWRENFGKYIGEWPPNKNPDIDCNGLVEMPDFYAWRKTFGDAIPSKP